MTIYAAPGSPTRSSPSRPATATTSAASGSSRSGRVLREHLPVNGKAVHRGRSRHRRGHRGRADAAHAAAEGWARTAPTEFQRPAQDRGPDGSTSDARGRRDLPLPRAARRRRPDHPVELPTADGGLEARPALAAGNCVVPSRPSRPGSILLARGLVGRPAPAGVLNVVNGFGVEAGKPLASSPASPRSRSPGRPRPAG